MKICIYGAGAIGGYLGVQLTRAGADVSLVARGPHLAAMRERGLKLLIGDEQHVVRPRCTDNPAELGPQDFVIVCLKAHSITGVIEAMQPLLGPRTRIVTAVNGIPYWYYKHGGSFEGSTLESIDPGGRQWRELTPQRAIGCIVYPATEIEAPGVIRMSTAIVFRSASRRERPVRTSNDFPLLSSKPACRRRCSTASATRSGSNCGAMCASIRSAH
jgi:2-dehydropantoate 2-reductase